MCLCPIKKKVSTTIWSICHLEADEFESTNDNCSALERLAQADYFAFFPADQQLSAAVVVHVVRLISRDLLALRHTICQ